jgi:hypothetical protein
MLPVSLRGEAPSLRLALAGRPCRSALQLLPYGPQRDTAAFAAIGPEFEAEKLPGQENVWIWPLQAKSMR